VITLTPEQAELVFCLAVLTEDRTLEEQSALMTLSEALDAVGMGGHADHANHTWSPEEAYEDG
jgi:hypothetical protein